MSEKRASVNLKKIVRNNAIESRQCQDGGMTDVLAVVRFIAAECRFGQTCLAINSKIMFFVHPSIFRSESEGDYLISKILMLIGLSTLMFFGMENEGNCFRNANSPHVPSKLHIQRCGVNACRNERAHGSAKVHRKRCMRSMPV